MVRWDSILDDVPLEGQSFRNTGSSTKSQVRFATFLSFSDILSLTFESQRVIVAPLRIVTVGVEADCRVIY